MIELEIINALCVGVLTGCVVWGVASLVFFGVRMQRFNRKAGEILKAELGSVRGDLNEAKQELKQLQDIALLLGRKVAKNEQEAKEQEEGR